LAELTQKERLQPSLLDRLTDDQPDKQSEGPDRRFLSLERLRAVIRRDLGWLLNTCNLASTEDLGPYPEVGSSVLNYGLPDLTGKSISNVDVITLERLVKQAVLDFEPRLLRNSIRVRAFAAQDQMNRNALTFQIEGTLWAHPAPVDVVLKSEFDLESGLVSVRD
jgi:type VI secretion system protein ImpF